MGILSGKRGLVIGVSNKWSIGSQIARECIKHGADTFITWHSERSRDYVEWLRTDLDHIDPMVDSGCFQLDVTDPEIHEIIKNGIRYNDFGGLDFVVHSVAKAPKECFESPYFETTLNDFNETMKVSVWSLVNLTKAVLPLMNDNGSILTMTYVGGRKIRPGYNIMGVAKSALDASVRQLAFELGEHKKIRVNALSPGPIKTISSSKIGVNNSINELKYISPLRYAPDQKEVSKAAIFLLSDMSKGITGTILDIDSGYNIMLSTIKE